MLIRDKVPPRFRSHFCFVLFCVPLSPWRGRSATSKNTFPAISRKRYRHNFVVGFIVPSRISARCVPLYRKIHRAVFFNRPEGARAGGGVVLGRGGLFFCLIGEQGLKHKG